MRLSPDQQATIVHCARQQFGAGARVLVFGSRLDDAARGGDVDLLVESATPPTLRQRALATLAMEQALHASAGKGAVPRATGRHRAPAAPARYAAVCPRLVPRACVPADLVVKL
jgi:predicted nucleotidyltransferase